jgi:predicted HicB family RNase H-like nuclease
MRLRDYLSEDIEEFRKLRIGLVREDTDKKGVVSKITKEFELKKDIVENIDKLNCELKKTYTGKFKFDFCIQEDIKAEALRLKREQVRDTLIEFVIRANDSLAKAKTELERKLSSND